MLATICLQLYRKHYLFEQESRQEQAKWRCLPRCPHSLTAVPKRYACQAGFRWSRLALHRYASFLSISCMLSHPPSGITLRSLHAWLRMAETVTFTTIQVRGHTQLPKSRQFKGCRGRSAPKTQALFGTKAPATQQQYLCIDCGYIYDGRCHPAPIRPSLGLISSSRTSRNLNASV